MRKFLLDIIPFHESHSSVNILKTLMNLLIKYNLATKVLALTTDNDSAMIACGRKMCDELSTKFNNYLFFHYRCGAHILNLAVQHGLQVHDEVVGKVRNFMNKIKKSNLLMEDLHRICELQNIPYLGPQIDIETRWNSTYLMLEKFQKIQIQANMLVAQHPDDFTDIYLTNEDWININVSIYIFINLLSI